MSDQYPLYPELSEDGKLEAEKLIEKFKIGMKKAAEEVLGEIYCDIPTHIESDSWTNFRNDLMSGFRNYGNRKLQADYDFKEIRQQIFFQFKDDILKDLDQDNLERISKLEKEVKEWRDRYNDLMDRRNY